MKTIMLGKKGPQVSKIGLGAWECQICMAAKRREMTKKVLQPSMQQRK